MSPRPRKSGRRGWPDNLYADRKGGRTYYRYRHPQTGQFHGLGSDYQAAAKAARLLNARLMGGTLDVDRLVAKVEAIDAPFREIAARFKQHLRERRNRRGRPLAEKTLVEYERMVDTAAAAWGERETAAITRRQAAEFLRRFPARTANAYRSVLRQLFAFAIAEGIRDDNPIEGTLKRTEVVQRQRLTLEQFRKIHKAAPHWFQCAMDLALQTLQRREDLVWIRFDDEREPGWLFVDQQKVEGHGTGHIRIRIGPQLRAVISRCRDDIVCPYMIHRRPIRTRREYIEAKDHPFQVAPEMLTRTFQRLRDQLGVAAELAPHERPSFHEIRALGADLYRKAGHSEEAIQRLLGHTSQKTTRTYLDRRGLEVQYVDAVAGLEL